MNRIICIGAHRHFCLTKASEEGVMGHKMRDIGLKCVHQNSRNRGEAHMYAGRADKDGKSG